MNAVLESRLGYRREPLGAGSETLIIANEYAKLNDIGNADLCDSPVASFRRICGDVWR